MDTTELRLQAQKAREAAKESRATALERLEDATRRLRRAQELRALSAAMLRLVACEPPPPAGETSVDPEDGPPGSFEAARRSAEPLHDEGVLDLGAAPRVRLFESRSGGVYRVRCTPFEANPAEGEARQDMHAIVFETLEGRWVGSVPVHPSCTLDGLSDRELGAFLAFAR